ncbi:hypothetical protein OG339_48905 (plasmid) [Streptosporangium sp. NBC_01495]|uniref:hypothetical protein n=1 Tax=Streptosporangium sp. NBC_01495 TaxID=2903899 RepID=UPI002E33B7FE|nr:hypothetical protein [Streptosporangium sp. NBC_01495]
MTQATRRARPPRTLVEQGQWPNADLPPGHEAYLPQLIARFLQTTIDRHGVDWTLQAAKKNGISPATINRLLHGRARAMLWDAMELEVAFATRLPFAPAQPPPFRPYTDEEIAALEQWADMQPEPLRAQCHILLALGAGCGLRADEALRVCLRDVRLCSPRLVVVQVTGPHERTVACSSSWGRTLRAQIEHLDGQDGLLLELGLHQHDGDSSSGAPSASEQIAALWARTIPWPAAPTLCMERLRATWLTNFTSLNSRPTMIAMIAGLDSVFDLPTMLRPGVRQNGEHNAPDTGEEPPAALTADGASKVGAGADPRPVGEGVPEQDGDHFVGVAVGRVAAVRHRGGEDDRLSPPAAEQVTPAPPRDDAPPPHAEPIHGSEHAAEPQRSGASQEPSAPPAPDEVPGL